VPLGHLRAGDRQRGRVVDQQQSAGPAVAERRIEVGAGHRAGSAVRRGVVGAAVGGADVDPEHVDGALQLVERYDYRPVSRAVFLRLDYRFGGSGKAAREPGFEYDTSGSSGPG